MSVKEKKNPLGLGAHSLGETRSSVQGTLSRFFSAAFPPPSFCRARSNTVKELMISQAAAQKEQGLVCSTHARTHVHTYPLALTTPHPAAAAFPPAPSPRGARASYASRRRPPVPRPGCSCGRRGRAGAARCLSSAAVPKAAGPRQPGASVHLGMLRLNSSAFLGPS